MGKSTKNLLDVDDGNLAEVISEGHVSISDEQQFALLRKDIEEVKEELLK